MDLNLELEPDVGEKYGHFLGDVLEAYCRIEGSEVGDAMENLRRAALEATNYVEGGWRAMLVLYDGIRRMVASDWFVRELEEEKDQRPHDYLTAGLREAREGAEIRRQWHLDRAHQYLSEEGGARAEALIRGWEAI